MIDKNVSKGMVDRFLPLLIHVKWR